MRTKLIKDVVKSCLGPSRICRLRIRQSLYDDVHDAEPHALGQASKQGRIDAGDNSSDVFR